MNSLTHAKVMQAVGSVSLYGFVFTALALTAHSAAAVPVIGAALSATGLLIPGGLLFVAGLLFVGALGAAKKFGQEDEPDACHKVSINPFLPWFGLNYIPSYYA